MQLSSARIALLIEDDYQELEGWYPLLRLREAGATVVVVGSGAKAEFTSKLGYPMAADVAAADVSADDFDAVIVPGGFAPDHMRLYPEMVALVHDAHTRGKLVATICHGGWLLASAGIARGRRVTGYRPIKDDLVNAGGTWVDTDVVRDGSIISSRGPDDLPAFLREIVAYLDERQTEEAHAHAHAAVAG
jgi:protease I